MRTCDGDTGRVGTRASALKSSKLLLLESKRLLRGKNLTMLVCEVDTAGKAGRKRVLLLALVGAGTTVLLHIIQLNTVVDTMGVFDMEAQLAPGAYGDRIPWPMG